MRKEINTSLHQLSYSHLHKRHCSVGALPLTVTSLRWHLYRGPTKTSPVDRVSGPDLSTHVTPADYRQLCDGTIHDGPTPSSNKKQSAHISILPDCLWSLIIVSMDRAAPT